MHSPAMLRPDALPSNPAAAGPPVRSLASEHHLVEFRKPPTLPARAPLLLGLGALV